MEKMLDTSEANNIWDLLKSLYMETSRLLIWENFAHDPDLKLVIKKSIKETAQHIQLLEKELKIFGIKGPDKNKNAVNTASNTEVLTDEFIAQEMFIMEQENVEQILRSLRTTTSNEHIRTLFKQLVEKAISRTDDLVQYLRIKGWIETPPLYLQIPAHVTEKLAAGEAFHLWDHLTFRYDNISQTEIFHAFAKDAEFKVILATGLQSSLKKQAALLEKELDYFGIPLPKRPKDYNMSAGNSELLDDDHMFRMLTFGIQGAAILHAQALKQCTVNDRVRGIFKDLLFEEIGYIDKLIMFGKLKGWMHPVPLYKLQ